MQPSPLLREAGGTPAPSLAPLLRRTFRKAVCCEKVGWPRRNWAEGAKGPSLGGAHGGSWTRWISPRERPHPGTAAISKGRGRPSWFPVSQRRARCRPAPSRSPQMPRPEPARKGSGDPPPPLAITSVSNPRGPRRTAFREKPASQPICPQTCLEQRFLQVFGSASTFSGSQFPS